MNDMVTTRVETRGDAGRVAYVTVNNPGERNALGRKGKEALIAAFRELAGDEALRVAVLTGAGDRSFIAGANLKEMAEVDWKNAEDISTKTHLACDAIRRLPVPVIARVNGYCLGAGMELAASCDMRVGVDTAKFGMPEVRFGIPSGMEACLLPGLIGWGKTREQVQQYGYARAHERLRRAVHAFLQLLVITCRNEMRVHAAHLLQRAVFGEAVDPIGAAQGEVLHLEQMAPQYLETKRRPPLTALPEQIDHLAERPHLAVLAPREIDGRADDILEALPVRHAIHHERRQRAASVHHGELAALLRVVERDVALGELAHTRIPMPGADE